MDLILVLLQVLQVLEEVLEFVNEEKPLTMKKYVFPMLKTLLSQNTSLKSDVRKCMNSLLGKLYDVCGEKLVNSFPTHM